HLRGRRTQVARGQPHRHGAHHPAHCRAGGVPFHTDCGPGGQPQNPHRGGGPLHLHLRGGVPDHHHHAVLRTGRRGGPGDGRAAKHVAGHVLQAAARHHRPRLLLQFLRVHRKDWHRAGHGHLRFHGRRDGQHAQQPLRPDRLFCHRPVLPHPHAGQPPGRSGGGM
ncbi:MAG: Uncharacterized MFS-type transporter, partial [uncultured Cytophagales bacterium]